MQRKLLEEAEGLERSYFWMLLTEPHACPARVVERVEPACQLPRSEQYALLLRSSLQTFKSFPGWFLSGSPYTIYILMLKISLCFWAILTPSVWNFRTERKIRPWREEEEEILNRVALLSLASTYGASWGPERWAVRNSFPFLLDTSPASVWIFWGWGEGFWFFL